MSSALFGTNSGSGSSSSGLGVHGRSKTLVEFKAGKMQLKGKMVHPDTRKGLIYAYQSEDSLMHFCWKDRTTGIVEDDLILFPDDIETRKVPQCTTGRVFLMKFKSSNKKSFYWMQETDAEKDDKLWKKLTDYFNNPPTPGSSNSSAMSGSSSSAAAALASALGGEGGDLQSILGSMSEQQLQNFLGGFIPSSGGSSAMNPSSVPNSASNQIVGSRTNGSSSSASSSTATPIVAGPTTTNNSSSAGSSASNSIPASRVPTAVGTESLGAAVGGVEPSTPVNQKIQFNDLKNILGNLAPQAGDYANGSSASSSLDLSDVITLDVMAPILANKDVQERLMKHLPDDSLILPRSEHELRTTFTTPQFKKAMSSFSSALKSGQLGPVMHQFNFPDQVILAANQGNLEAFTTAMQTFMKEKQLKQETPATKSTEAASEQQQQHQDQDTQMDTK